MWQEIVSKHAYCNQCSELLRCNALNQKTNLLMLFYCKSIDNELSQPSPNFYTVQLGHTNKWHTHIYMTI